MQEKASRVGFDWPNIGGVLEKSREELRELAEARREKQTIRACAKNSVTCFFTLVNLSRALGIDAETAMREANEKFYRRFAFMEERAAAKRQESFRPLARRTRGTVATGEDPSSVARSFACG